MSGFRAEVRVYECRTELNGSKAADKLPTNESEAPMMTAIAGSRNSRISAKFRGIAAFAAMVLALGACDRDSTGPTATAALELRNDANVPIVSVNIASCSDESWGGNRLNSSETIAPGATRTWSLTPGCWDVRASTANKSGSWFDREVTAGGTIRLALPPEAGT
jgi:hypothetical protein